MSSSVTSEEAAFYSAELATLVAAQLERFATLNRHQLAGHVANLDFWIGEARHALAVIDGYQPRFRAMKAGQESHIREHGILASASLDPSDSGVLGRPPDLPGRVSDASLRARLAVTEATYRFLVRCCNDRLIAEEQLRAICKGMDISVDPADLRRRTR